MEKVQERVTSVKEFGDPDQYGNKNFWVSFEDGSSGMFRTPNNDLFVEGKLAEYAIKEYREGKNGRYAVLQRYKEPYTPGQQSQSSGKKSPETDAQISRSVAIKAAAELLAGSSNNTPERVIEAAEIFFDYIQFGVKDGEETPKNEHKDENVLPWEI